MNEEKFFSLLNFELCYSIKFFSWVLLRCSWPRNWNMQKALFKAAILFISTAENSKLQSACFLGIFYGLLFSVLTTVRIFRGREVKWLVCGYLANDAGGVGIQIVSLPSWNPDNCRYFAKCSVCRKQTDCLSTHPTSLLIFFLTGC